MKVLTSLALVASASIFGFACTHGSSTEAQPASASSPTTSSVDSTVSPTSQPNAKDGWENIKDGTKQAASGVGEAAKAGGNKVVDGSKELAHDVKSATCPVLGNKLNKTYYSKDSRSYNSLLSGKTALASENRECFSNEANAREAGYKSSVN